MRVSLSLALFCALFTACASTSGGRHRTPAVGAEQDFSLLADELMRTAELRTDVRSMRVCVHTIAESDIARDYRLANARPGYRSPETGSDPVSLELRQELVIALSNRLNVVASEQRPEPPGSEEDEFERLVHEFGVTHVLVGDYAQRDDRIVVSLRLIDASTRLIAAASRAAIPASRFSDPVRDELRVRGTPHRIGLPSSRPLDSERVAGSTNSATEEVTTGAPRFEVGPPPPSFNRRAVLDANPFPEPPGTVTASEKLPRSMSGPRRYKRRTDEEIAALRQDAQLALEAELDSEPELASAPEAELVAGTADPGPTSEPLAGTSSPADELFEEVKEPPIRVDGPASQRMRARKPVERD